MRVFWSLIPALPGIMALAWSVAHAQSTLESVQPHREVQEVRAGGLRSELVNLNKHVNSWYLLRIQPQGGKTISFNLVNPAAPVVHIRLQLNNPETLEFVQAGKVTGVCDRILKVLQSSQAKEYPFSPICDGRLYVKNRANGYQPNIEKGAQFLRDHLGGVGEEIINKAKGSVFDGKYDELAKSDRSLGVASGVQVGPLKGAMVEPHLRDQVVSEHQLGVAVSAPYDPRTLKVGEWYPSSLHPGVFVSMVAPGWLAQQVLNSHPKRVGQLQARELQSLVYLVAFDMKAYTLGWAHGTSQPDIGWSSRLAPEQIKAMGGGEGPEGIGSFGELVNPGQVPPWAIQTTIATISGGFQLLHSHFPRGPLSRVNKSSHYGFIEDGVVMMKPNPGLATIVVHVDGSMTMKVWSEKDNVELAKVRYLRQNGVPIIEPDSSGQGIPGAFVNNRNEGNWSGSVEGDNFTPRGAACLIAQDDQQFFVYAYFSAATPNAIARVFQAYRCQVGIHLDMNSPGQAYLALMTTFGKKTAVQPLVRPMMEVNPARGVPRFLAHPDFRDFFWVQKR